MYALIEDGRVAKYPYTLADLKAPYPDMVWPEPIGPELLEQFGVIAVIPAAQPEYLGYRQGVSELAPVLVNGEWTQQWEVYDLPAEDVAANRARMIEHVWTQIKVERDRRQRGGVRVGDKWFHSDDASRIQQISLVMVGANIPPGLQWKTMDGTFVVMTPTLAGQVFATSIASDQAIFARAEEHRAAMAKLENPALYDYKTGWPVTFTEAKETA